MTFRRNEVFQIANQAFEIRLAQSFQNLRPFQHSLLVRLPFREGQMQRQTSGDEAPRPPDLLDEVQDLLNAIVASGESVQSDVPGLLQRLLVAGAMPVSKAARATEPPTWLMST